MSKRWIHVLLAALGVDVVLAVVVRAHELHRFAGGHPDTESTLSFISFAWLLVVVAAAAAVGRSLYATRRTLYRQSQAIAADASLSRDWLWEADTQHRLTYSSGGVRDVLGYEPRDLLGRCMLDLMAADQREHAEHLMRHALATRTG